MPDQNFFTFVSLNGIAFLDFWDSFDPNNNFLTHLFKSVKEDIEVVEPSKADTIIFSCFGNSNSYYRDKKKIYFTDCFFFGQTLIFLAQKRGRGVY